MTTKTLQLQVRDEKVEQAWGGDGGGELEGLLQEGYMSGVWGERGLPLCLYLILCVWFLML